LFAANDFPSKSDDATRSGVKRFAKLEDLEVELVINSGKWKSKHFENWAARAFN
jgi:hypothetical protein